MKKLLLLAMAVALVGCVGSPAATAPIAEKNRKLILQLNAGMAKAEVQKIMGDPRETETYPSGSGTHEIWFYRTNATPMSRRERTNREVQFTPFVFKNGKLEGWGRNYYETVIKIRKEIIRK